MHTNLGGMEAGIGPEGVDFYVARARGGYGLLGVGVSGLEAPDERGIEYDSAEQKALDRTLDEIRRRYGENKATHAGTLRTGKKGAVE